MEQKDVVSRKQSALLDTTEINVREVEGETRSYFLFREQYSDIPMEVIITEIPPHSIEGWHSHKTIDEVIIPIDGEVVALTRDENGSNQSAEPIKMPTIYNPEKDILYGISAVSDGLITLYLEDRETGKFRAVDVPYKEGFHTGRTIHTIENRSDHWAVTAAIKRTSKEKFQENSKIFQEDKVSY